MTERERPGPDETPGGAAAPAAPPAYTSGERVSGPPQGTSDLGVGGAPVAERLPGPGWDASWRLAVRAWEGLRANGELDQESLARHLAATGPAGGSPSSAGGSPSSAGGSPSPPGDDPAAPGEAERVAARVAVDLATAYGVDPTG